MLTLYLKIQIILSRHTQIPSIMTTLFNNACDLYLNNIKKLKDS